VLISRYLGCPPTRQWPGTQLRHQRVIRRLRPNDAADVEVETAVVGGMVVARFVDLA
jgi:hypothetical protein